jgi:GDP-mannose 6-dehydrogenase
VKVSVLGLGYVGCVSAACLARDGHTVVGVDVNPRKLELVASGRSPVIEPGLDELVQQAVEEGRIRVTDDVAEAVKATDVSLICVGTPGNRNTSIDLRQVENTSRQIGAAIRENGRYHVIVVRSTVLPGTVGENVVPLLEESSGGLAGEAFGICMNPEFMREGSAIKDYYEPSFIVVGEFDRRSGDAVEALYEAVDAPVIRTDIRTAEMVKYVCNTFHAVKVAFANEIGNLCKAHGIDGQEVMDIFVRDHRLNISAAYLRPGFAFGGSCLPKDVRALLYSAKEKDVDCRLLAAALESNNRHIRHGIDLVEATGLKKVGVLGLSFKSGTDDVRESPIVALVETLVGRGYEVRVHDTNVDPDRLIGANKSFLERELPHIAALMSSSVREVVAESQVLVVANGDPAFRQVGELVEDGQIVIDLTGVAKNNGNVRGAYQGICW